MPLSEVTVIEIPANKDDRGILCAFEFDGVLSFLPKRMFYVSSVPNHLDRGGHAHRKTIQVLIAISGSLKIELNDGFEKKIYVLDEIDKALVIPPLIWDRLFDFSDDAVLVCLCSTSYDRSDYVFDYEEFLGMVNNETS